MAEPLSPARWFLVEAGEQVGPHALSELRDMVIAGSITGETWVWADGMPEWLQARDVPALRPPAQLTVPAPSTWR